MVVHIMSIMLLEQLNGCIQRRSKVKMCEAKTKLIIDDGSILVWMKLIRTRRPQFQQGQSVKATPARTLNECIL